MSLSSYLSPRGKRGIIQLRVPIPRAIQPMLGKRERILSMATSDRKIAEDRALKILPLWKAEFAGAQAIASGGLRQPPTAVTLEASQTVPTTAELEEAAVTVGFDFELADMDQGRANMRNASVDLWSRNAAFYRSLMLERARDVATGNTAAVQHLADDALETLGWAVPKGSDQYEQFCRLVAQTNLASLKLSIQRNEGDVDADTDNKLVRKVRERKAQSAAAGESILDHFERYAAQRLAEKRKRPDTIDQDRKVIKGFADFVGIDRSVATITGDDVRDWIETLEKLPPNYGKMNAYKGLGVRAVAAKAASENGARPTFTTLNKYLSTVSPLFRWLIKRGHHRGRNPCDNLFYEVPKGSNPRPPFTTEQLNKILASPLFNGFQRDGKEHLKGEQRADDWRYWIPLVCLFTGARLGEVAQLRVEDVCCERGVWFIHIRDDPATGQTTKSGLSRAAPVHSKLQALGFLDFHKRESARAAIDSNAAMFPELEKGARGQISEKVSRFWRDYLEDIGVKNGRDGFGAHSFRHTLADRLRDEAELLDNEIAVTLGHNQKSTTSGYGRLQQGTVTMLKGYFEGVRFDGVKLDHLKHAAIA